MRPTILLAPLVAAMATLTLAGSATTQEVRPAAWADGVSATAFITDRVVYGANGEDLGAVRDLIVGEDGRIVAIVVVIEGDFGIGGTVARLPVTGMEGGMIGGEPAILLPISEDDIPGLSVFGDDEDHWARSLGPMPADAAPFWRLSSRIGDPVRVRDEDGDAGFGIVEDFIIVDGRVEAAVVVPDASIGAGGRRIYPVDRTVGGWNARSGEILLDLDLDEALAVAPSGPPRAR